MVRASSRRGCSRTLILAALVGLAACRPAATPRTQLTVVAPEADADADVYVDGTYVGRIGELEAAGTDGIVLAAGVHRVEIRKPGRFPVQRTVRVDAATPAQVVLEAELLEDPL